MPWCPKCFTEYNDGVLKCYDCGETLVSKLEVTDNKSSYDTPKLLTVAENDLEADIIESLLKGHNIPIHRKYKNIDGYIKIVAGISYNEVFIYVPSKLYSLAKDILHAPNEPLTDEITQYNDEGNRENDFNWNKLRSVTSRIYTYILAGILIIMLLIKYFIT